MSVKLRHVAALALVGWYLLFPPTIDEIRWICGDSFTAAAAHDLFGWGKNCGNGAMSRVGDVNAPLSAWHQAGEFEHLADCRQMWETLCEWETDDNKGKQPFERVHQRCYAECVASDNPRLAK